MAQIVMHTVHTLIDPPNHSWLTDENIDNYIDSEESVLRAAVL